MKTNRNRIKIIYSLKSVMVILVLIIIAISLAVLTTYLYNYFFQWNRYWGGTQENCNFRMAVTSTNFIKLYGPEKFAEVADSDMIERNFDNFGYNLFLDISRNGKIVARRHSYYTTYNPKIFNVIDCSVAGMNESCFIRIFEDLGTSARNLDEQFFRGKVNWLKNWFVNPLDNIKPKFDNFTVFFLSFFFAWLFFLTSLILFYYYNRLRIQKNKRDYEEKIDLLNNRLNYSKDFENLLTEDREKLINDAKKYFDEWVKSDKKNIDLKNNYESAEKQLDLLNRQFEILKNRNRQTILDFLPNIKFDPKILDEIIINEDKRESELFRLLTLIQLKLPLPAGANKKKWQGSRRGYENVYEFRFGKKERVFIQNPDSTPLICDIDYEHKHKG